MNSNKQHEIYLPEQRNYDRAYAAAYQIAADKLRGTDDIEILCANSGSTHCYNDDKTQIKLNYLNGVYVVDIPDITVRSKHNNKTLKLSDSILILHYLINANGSLLTNNLISFKELPGVSSYYPTFRKRAVNPLIEKFGDSPADLITASRSLGFAVKSNGDASVIIQAFERVPVNIIIWGKDDEFPPDANILFDSNITDYLSIEDIIVLCQSISLTIIKSVK